MAHLEAHVVHHVDAAHAGRVGGAEIAVDVLVREPRVLQRALGAFGMQLRHRFVHGEARRMFERADDIGLSFDAHELIFLR